MPDLSNVLLVSLHDWQLFRRIFSRIDFSLTKSSWDDPNFGGILTSTQCMCMIFLASTQCMCMIFLASTQSMSYIILFVQFTS